MQTRNFTASRVALLMVLLLGISTTPAWCGTADYSLSATFGGNAATYFGYYSTPGAGYAFGQLEYEQLAGTVYTFTSSDTFNLLITETSPSAGSNTFYGTFSGTTSSGNTDPGTVELSFTYQSLKIGTETYKFDMNPVFPIDTSALFKLTFLDGTVTSTVPEPSSAGLLAVILLGCYCVVRRGKALGSR